MTLASSRQFWQEALLDLITDPKELFELLELDTDLLPAAYEATKLFPLKVTRSFVARMQKRNIHDPLLKQVLPLGIELANVAGYEKDPLQETKSAVNPVPGLLHKYAGRVLVTLTSACAIHCRYCFRRHFPYSENNPGRKGWEKIFAYIDENKNIHEVILSGGDPFSMSDKVLKSFTDQLNLIPHVSIVRVHTRLPIVLPERITDDLLNWMKQLKQSLAIVVHTSHPQEINDEVRFALAKVRETNASLLNQSVLLKSINDDADTLVMLSRALFAAGVLPYYLHVHDKVAGTAHFDIPLEQAQSLHRELVKRLPGYLVPRLVRETANEVSKVNLAW